MWAAGSAPLCLEAGTYLVHIEMTSGTRVRIDQLRLRRNETAVAPSSWSHIRSLY